MKKVDLNIKSYYLYPSSLFVNKEQHKVFTILGSCIAVCLYDTEMKIGGINHYMLPLWNGNGLATPKYGNVAIDKLISQLEELNCKKKNMVAKIFGGASSTGASFNIGERNAEVAFDHMKAENIRVVAQNVGGKIGRKIIFDTSTSEVLMKFIGKPSMK